MNPEGVTHAPLYLAITYIVIGNKGHDFRKTNREKSGPDRSFTIFFGDVDQIRAIGSPPQQEEGWLHDQEKSRSIISSCRRGGVVQEF